MPGYVVVGVDVHDPEAYREYQQRVPATIEQYGGKFLVRGGEFQAVEGQPPPRIVVIEFPSVEQARTWYDSPEYQAILPIRRRHSTAAFLAIVPSASA